MKNDQLPEDMVLNEAQLRDVIDRAARMMPPSEGITIADLRQIAAELDLDPKAVDRALDQVIGLPIPGHPIRTWFKRNLTALGRQIDRYLPEKGRILAGGLFGAVAGWLNAFLPDTFAMQTHYPVAVAMVGITIANLLSRRLEQNLPKYLAETLVLWGTYGIMWSVTHGEPTGNLMTWVGLWSALATIGGWSLMRGSKSDGEGGEAVRERVAPQNLVANREPEDRDLHQRIRWTWARFAAT